MIKAVIFDMDGLMIDSEKIGDICSKKACKELGYEYTRELLKKEIGMTAANIQKLFFNYFGRNFNYNEFVKLRDGYMDKCLKENGVPVKAGLYELLKFLKHEGYKTAVATSTQRERTKWYLKSIKATEYFDRIICGDMIEKSKPDPEIYLKAAGELNVKPEECLVLEDSPNGITSAFRAGIKTIMIPDMIEPDEELKKMLFSCVKSLKDVIEILKNN